MELMDNAFFATWGTDATKPQTNALGISNQLLIVLSIPGMGNVNIVIQDFIHSKANVLLLR